ncbi:MAG TPA: sigma-70 family RNA polymerase sigma factor [Candidatus Angelobacter sp.]|nr:sigma-70 family RNA polymerase sigma factor [Candidatus Angelobacter sp.]
MNTETRIRDEWLALRCQANEPGAYEDLVATLEKPLLYYAIRLTGNRETALDVLQEAWIRALRGIPKLQDAGSIRPWLYSVVHGIAVDDFRRKKAREKVEEVCPELPETSEPETFDAADASDIHVALDQLEPRHKEVLTLYFLEEFTVAEIAKVVGCPEGTVKSRLHHAKKTMRTILTGGKYAIR